MTDNSSLEQTLCFKFCSYYKPGKNEELACRGYIVAERLLRQGKSLVFESKIGESNPVPADTIVKTLCSACDFHTKDCDFMQDRAARPCGGFVLLERLLGSGVIRIQDIE